MTHEIELEMRAVAPIQPHARALLERARKLEALPLTDLAARVAEGLAQLRLSYGLEARDADPMRALLSALPRTELARRSTDLAVELDTARASVVERERAAAEVERRSESLKEALRERSADLAVALARADEAVSARRELDAVRAQLGVVRAELDDVRAQRDDVRARLGEAASDRERLGVELARALEDVRLGSSELAEARRRMLELAADHERVLASERADHSEPDPRLELARSALAAAAERERARARLAELERAGAAERSTLAEQELTHLRRERDTIGDELRRLQSELEARAALHRSAIEGYERALAESRRDAEPARRELEWRRREMDALREASRGMRWKLLGGDVAERIARWNREGSP